MKLKIYNLDDEYIETVEFPTIEQKKLDLLSNLERELLISLLGDRYGSSSNVTVEESE
jgi:hypothetical protein